MKKKISMLLVISMLNMNMLYAFNSLGAINDDFKDGGHVNAGSKNINESLNVEHTYNPSKKIGEAISDSKFIDIYQTVEDKQKNFAKEFNEVSKALDLPVGASMEKTKLTKGEIKWSLVNPETCEPDFKAAFSAAINDLIEKYKKMFEQLMDKSVWELWLFNQVYKLLCFSFAFKNCLGDMTFIGKKMAEFQTKFSKCLGEVQKGTQKTVMGSKGGITGVAAGYAPGSGVGTPSPVVPFSTQNNTVFYIPPVCAPPACPIPPGKNFVMPDTTGNTETTVDMGAVASNPSAAIGCVEKSYHEVFGEDNMKCIEKKTDKCLSFFNGKVDLGLDMFLIKFKMKKQECVFAKYKTEIKLQDIVDQALEVHKQGANGAVKFVAKNPPYENLDVIAGSLGVVTKQAQNILKARFKRLNFLINNSEEAVYKDFLIAELIKSTLNIKAWTEFVFANSSKTKQVKKDTFDLTLIDGRWVYKNELYGKPKKDWIGNDNFPTTIYDECQKLADDTNLFLSEFPMKEHYTFRLQIVPNSSSMALYNINTPIVKEILDGKSGKYKPIKKEDIIGRGNAFLLSNQSTYQYFKNYIDLLYQDINKVKERQKKFETAIGNNNFIFDEKYPNTKSVDTFEKFVLMNSNKIFDLYQISIMNELCNIWSNKLLVDLLNNKSKYATSVTANYIQLTNANGEANSKEQKKIAELYKTVTNQFLDATDRQINKVKTLTQKLKANIDFLTHIFNNFYAK